jgi:hypothetical protein
METQTTLNVEVSQYTDDQLKAARDAIMMWEAGPVNPCGVSGALNRAILAEFHATRQMEDSGPATVIINNALNNIINRQCGLSVYDLSTLFDAIDECRKRVAGTEYEWKG